ncbi:MAG TPA: hypothetical protein DCR97_09010 [Deltaproteobacteria bacterium]|nr:hypothetical protein [Deltaproteobacteria bacterium]
MGESAQLVLLFGSRSIIEKQQFFEEVKHTYPKAYVFGCSTSGEIHGTEVEDDSLVVTAVHFQQTPLKGACVNIADVGNSYGAGRALADSLPSEGLRHLFVLSDGLNVNGTELVNGMTDSLPKGVIITGGLSGDGDRFERTYVVWDGTSRKNTVAAIGFYGDSLQTGYGSLGGWDPFGPERLVTKSKANVLYELDRRPCLELYKKYLGAHAAGLPAAGLLFPLSLRTYDGQERIVRTILGVNEEEQSMTFAGDLPEGSYVRLMKANLDRLVDGAIGAARISWPDRGSSPCLAILVSCVGRRLVLKQRIEEETEGVQDVLGEGAFMTGFYSYGEISPFRPGASCALHNQTMTVTTFAEEGRPS